MSTTERLQLAPVPASIENPEDWDALAQQITQGTGMPPVVTPALIVGMIGSAVPLLFEADGSGNADLLRGTFVDPVVVQCARNPGQWMGAQPTSVAVHLVGSRVEDGHPVVRAHLVIQVRRPDGTPGSNGQFWDIQFGGHLTVGQPNCPNCGAPIADGALICGHCHSDVRGVVDVPIVVSRLELY
jgi:ribosomal protein S27AE